MDMQKIESIKKGIEKEIGHSNFIIQTHRSNNAFIYFTDKNWEETATVKISSSGRVIKNSYRVEKQEAS